MKDKNLLIKILIVIYGIAIITFSIMSTVIYIYTIYYYAVSDGFWGAVFGLALPGISSIWLFFELIGVDGLFNNFTCMILIWLISTVISAIPIFIKNK